MENIAVVASLAGALAHFLWVLTRNDYSSAYWAEEAKNVAARTTEAIASTRSR
jgi:hypothetical protein